MFIAVKSGLMKIIGNLTKTVNVIKFVGWSVAGTDNINEKHEKANIAIRIPGMMIHGFIVPHIPKTEVPRINGISVNIHPKIKALQILPIKSVFNDIGQVINLSSVFCLVSQGKITGPIEVAIKKETIAIKPEII